MKTTTFGNHLHPALEQLHRNTCLWIGHMNSGPADHLAGQTFQCPEEGSLSKIQVYSIAVSHPGRLILTLHEFDKQRKNWGQILSSAEIEVDESDAENWIQFPLQTVHLLKDKTYGFRIKSPDTLVAIGERQHGQVKIHLLMVKNGIQTILKTKIIIIVISALHLK